ncbi:aspartate/glutamate racemase family protein [Desulfoplanes sp.]
MKIAVIAGTRYDTALGCSILERSGILCHPVPMARTPEEQNLLQYKDSPGLQKKVEDAVSRLERKGFTGVMVFCNSLAACLDLERLRQTTPLDIVTPLDVYERLARQWDRIFLITANGHTLADIERLLLSRNPAISISGFSSLGFVKLIEQEPPDRAFEEFPFAELVSMALRQDNQAIVLGCTHLTGVFPHIREISPLPVIDTGTAMAGIAMASLGK